MLKSTSPKSKNTRHLNLVAALVVDTEVALDGPMHFEIPGTPVKFAASSQAASAVVGCVDGSIHVLDLSSQAIIHHWAAHESAVRQIAMSPDGRFVASAAEEYSVRLYDLETKEFIGSPLAHEGTISEIKFDQQSNQLLTGDFQVNARLWDARSGRLLVDGLHHPDSSSPSGLFGDLTPDGSLVVTAGSHDLTVRVWDSSRGEQIHQGLYHGASIECLAIAPDGRRLATGAGDQMVRIWDLHTGQLLAPPLRHGARINHLQWNHLGTSLLIASHSGSSRLWHQPPGEIPVPEHVLDFAEAYARKRIRGSGAMQLVEYLDLAATRTALLEETAGRSSRADRWGHWLASDPYQRTINPDHPHSHDDYLARLVDAGQEDHLEEALLLHPLHPRAMAHLARSLAANGTGASLERARFLIAKALALAPSDEEIQKLSRQADRWPD